MSKEQDIFNRTVAEAIRQAKLLFQPRLGRSSETQRGLVPLSPADASHFLNGDAPPAFAAVTDADLALSDIVANNVSTARHGFTPKLPNDATKYLDGTGNYTVPPGSGTSLPAFPAISNLELRYSARLSQIDMASDGRVTKWYDISGNARHTNVMAGTNRPLYLPKRFNGGYPCLRFNGSAHRFALPSFTLPQPYTVVTVMQNAVNQGGNQHLVNLNNQGIIFIGAGPEWFMFAGSNMNPTSYVQTTTDLTQPDTTNPVVQSHVFNGASSKIRINATERTGNPGAGNVASGGTISIGSDLTATVGSFIKLFAYEILIFSKALSSPEMASLETYYNDPTVAGIVLV